MENIEEKLENIVTWANEKKAEEIAVIDVSRKSSFTDRFVLCTGNGKVHTKAIAENILDKAKQNQYLLIGKEGIDVGEWILLDYGDIIVHIFDEPIRGHYNLEELWRKMPNREIQEG